MSAPSSSTTVLEETGGLLFVDGFGAEAAGDARCFLFLQDRRRRRIYKGHQEWLPSFEQHAVYLPEQTRTPVTFNRTGTAIVDPQEVGWAEKTFRIMQNGVSDISTTISNPVSSQGA